MPPRLWVFHSNALVQPRWTLATNPWSWQTIPARWSTCTIRLRTCSMTSLVLCMNRMAARLAALAPMLTHHHVWEWRAVHATRIPYAEPNDFKTAPYQSTAWTIQPRDPSSSFTKNLSLAREYQSKWWVSEWEQVPVFRKPHVSSFLDSEYETMFLFPFKGWALGPGPSPQA